MSFCYTTIENVSGETQKNCNTNNPTANLREDSFLTVKRNLEILEQIGFDDNNQIDLD